MEDRVLHLSENSYPPCGAHHLNEVILVFLIRLIINYLDVNCLAVDGKISIISKEQIGVGGKPARRRSRKSRKQ